MGIWAFTFPGQGSQTVGMGKALADTYPEARAVFDEVDTALDQNLSQIMFEGPEDALRLTANAQPALMATAMAALRVLETRGVSVAANAKYVAGHSLGEYAALCAAGAIGLADTARLLRIRGTAMQAAVPVGEGGMAALLGLDTETVEAIAAEASANGRVCALANDNAPGQLVVSGHADAVEKAMALAKDKGCRRAVPLPVSAPFHCPLMAPAADTMRSALAEVTIAVPVVPVVANVVAQPVTEPQDIRARLVEQVTGRVRWTETIAWLTGDAGITHLAEIGTGKVLSGLARRTAPDVTTLPVGEPADIDRFIAALAE